MTKIELEDDADENTHHYRFDGIGRLTLDTMHGMINHRRACTRRKRFTFRRGKRKDHILLPAPTIEENTDLMDASSRSNNYNGHGNSLIHSVSR